MGPVAARARGDHQVPENPPVVSPLQGDRQVVSPLRGDLQAVSQSLTAGGQISHGLIVLPVIVRARIGLLAVSPHRGDHQVIDRVRIGRPVTAPGVISRELTALVPIPGGVTSLVVIVPVLIGRLVIGRVRIVPRVIGRLVIGRVRIVPRVIGRVRIGQVGIALGAISREVIVPRVIVHEVIGRVRIVQVGIGRVRIVRLVIGPGTIVHARIGRSQTAHSQIAHATRRFQMRLPLNNLTVRCS